MQAKWTVPVLVLALLAACSSGDERSAVDHKDAPAAPAALVAPQVHVPAAVVPEKVVAVAPLHLLRAHPRVIAQARTLARDRYTMRVGLERAESFFGMIEAVLSEHGLPRELAFVPMVESVFHPDARSRRAVGLWQFGASTARAYGLKVGDGIDERRDPEKSTRAAILYLRDLHERFGTWELALAAYNAGPSRVARALAKLPGATFWKLSEAKLLPPITRRYVPKVIGSALVADDPERFGLQLPDGLAAVAFSQAG
ncbi:MAG: lytic transglycosylase domain-containing protein [Deltaproteobacteria bacterium]